MTGISLNANSSIINCKFREYIELSRSHAHEICLLGFHTWNSIPNISEKLRNNKIYYTVDKVLKEITIPTGTYDISDINNYVKNIEPGIEIFDNNNTLKVEILSKYEIDFTKSNSINSLLGFSNQIIPINKKTESDLVVDIMKVNTVRIKCNIAEGIYENNERSNMIYQFHIKDNPGYKIDEVPRNLIYYPLNTHSINEINIRICDQDNNLIDFRNENINIILHIRKTV